MTHERNHQSTFDRLKNSTTAKITATLLAATVAGCGASASTPNQAARGSTPKPVAAGTRTPGPKPSERASSTPTTPETAPAVPKGRWCKLASAIVGKAFYFVNPVAECTVPATPPTPGMPFVRWDNITSPSAIGYSVEASEINASFANMTGHAPVVTVGSGDHTAQAIVVPKADEIFVDMGGNTVGVLQVFSGNGGSFPVGAAQSLTEAAAIFPDYFEGITPYGQAG